MPFTFSHPAAVLPLGYFPKRFFSMTGLVIGSIAPDFEYFFRLTTRSYYSHTWTGLFWFDLPLTLILAFLYHEVVRDRLIDNLPGFLAKRLIVFKNFNWVKYFQKNVIVVIISIIIGVASHIIWDRFTHERGLFADEINKLKIVFFSIAGHHINTYNLLQGSSTIIGGVIVIYALFRLPPDKSFTRQRSISPFWLSVGLITLAIVEIRVLRGLNYNYFRDLVVTIISGGLLGLVLTSKFLPAKL